MAAARTARTLGAGRGQEIAHRDEPVSQPALPRVDSAARLRLLAPPHCSHTLSTRTAVIIPPGGPGDYTLVALFKHFSAASV